jgi:peptidoglycan/xylan/chitin deacetylase (PgdA/CDA1 family)
MDIGSHTRTHADLTQSDPKAALNEIKESKRELQFALNYEVRHFCYPSGRFNECHVAMVEESGYATATTTRRGRVIANDNNPVKLNRIMIARATNLFLFYLKVSTKYEDRYI